MWTRFMDMHSGGGQKEKWHLIYIEMPQEEAELVFYNRFGHNPNRVTCTCCGEDYSISEYETLQEATAYERNCEWRDGKYHEEQNTRMEHYYYPEDWPPEEFAYQTLEEYMLDASILIIPVKDIKDDELEGCVPTQGYVWQD